MNLGSWCASGRESVSVWSAFSQSRVSQESYRGDYYMNCANARYCVRLIVWYRILPTLLGQTGPMPFSRQWPRRMRKAHELYGLDRFVRLRRRLFKRNRSPMRARRRIKRIVNNPSRETSIRIRLMEDTESDSLVPPNWRAGTLGQQSHTEDTLVRATSGERKFISTVALPSGVPRARRRCDGPGWRDGPRGESTGPRTLSVSEPVGGPSRPAISDRQVPATD